MHDADRRIRSLAQRLGHLAEALDPLVFRDLIGAVEVEVETGEEVILEQRLRRPRSTTGVVLSFPGAQVAGRRPEKLSTSE